MGAWTSVLAASALATALAQSPARLLDLDGGRVDPFERGDGKAFVFVFVRADCPISNRYAPELARLHTRLAASGVAFRLVYPGDTSGDAIRRHVREYGYPFPALRDPDFSFVDAVGATVTPEAAVFDSQRMLRYLGRIDDRYISVGRMRPSPARRDLETALDALVAGKPIAHERTPAFGCLISDLR